MNRRNLDLFLFKFWEKVYDVSYFVFGNLPITWDVKNQMNMAYVRYHLHTDKK